MIEASPLRIACQPKATARRPEPQSWLMPSAVFSTGMPELTAAWRAGFWPCAALRIWPMMTSSTSSGFTLARSSAPLIAALPRSWAGTAPNAPLNEPMGVRAALAMTISVAMVILLGVPPCSRML